jgi:hypothetical protein
LRDVFDSDRFSSRRKRDGFVLCWRKHRERRSNRPDRVYGRSSHVGFGTKVLVTNVGNGKTVIVRITDRGPHRRGRIMDVSHAAARELDMIDSGTTLVSVVRQ